MPTDSHRERVIAAIRVSSLPLDDDQLAARTGISPRQAVNQICRALERAGMVRRRPGPDGKIVNEWLGNQDRDPESRGRQAPKLPGRALAYPYPRRATGDGTPGLYRRGIPVSSVARSG